MESYAVLWSAPSAPVEAGKLELEPSGLRFESSAGTRQVPYREIEALHIGRVGPERLGGRPALVLDLFMGGPLRIGSIDGAGLLQELAQRLGTMRTAGVAA